MSSEGLRHSDYPQNTHPTFFIRTPPACCTLLFPLHLLHNPFTPCDPRLYLSTLSLRSSGSLGTCPLTDLLTYTTASQSIVKSLSILAPLSPSTDSYPLTNPLRQSPRRAISSVIGHLCAHTTSWFSPPCLCSDCFHHQGGRCFKSTCLSLLLATSKRPRV